MSKTAEAGSLLEALVDNTAEISTTRRNALALTALGSVLLFTNAKTDNFKIMEVVVANDALFGCLYFGLLYFFLQFAYKSAALFVVWRQGRYVARVKNEIERERDAGRLSNIRLAGEVHIADVGHLIGRGKAATVLTWLLMIFDFILPALFAIFVLAHLASRFNFDDFHF